MRFFRNILLIVCSLVWSSCDSAQNANPSESIPVYTSYYDSIPYEKEGELVAKHCQSCHQLPNPQDLPKYAWEYLILPQKAQFMGVKMANIFDLASFRTPDNSHLFPSQPLISQEEWEQLVSYFIHQAPVFLDPQGEHPETIFKLKEFEVLAVPGQRFQPYASLLQIDENRNRIYLGDGKQEHIQVWTPDLVLEETLEVFGIPSHIRWGANGDHELMLKPTLTPSDYYRGEMFKWKVNTEKPKQENRVLDDLPYTNDVQYEDLNKDGKEDIILSGQGFYIGKLVWYEKLERNAFQEHILADIPGALKTVIHDFDQNNLPDILTLFGQGQEKFILFWNKGEGVFEPQTLLQFPVSQGSTDFQLIDINEDGHKDILHTSGQNKYPVFYKNYHGLRIFLSVGQDSFTEAYFFPLNGANQVEAVDYDEDGDIDIALTSFFPDYKESPDEAFVYLENTGNLTFQPKSFEKHPRAKWGLMESGDVDGDGDIDIVLANNMLNAEKDSPAHQKLWRLGTPSLVILNNRLR